MDLLAAMRIYVRVVERGTMSGAARDLDMGQPAVSERIGRLEELVGAKLLMRSARTLQCTEAGKVFYERSCRLLADAEEAIASVRPARETLDGRLRIASSQCYGETVVADVLRLARARYPRLRIDLVLNDNMVDPVTEGVDISIRLGTLGDGRFLAYPMGQVQRFLIAAPSYLARHPFIRVRGIFPNEQLSLIHPDGNIEPASIRTAFTTTHWRPMFDMIMAGAGIGVVQGPACTARLAEGSLVRLLPGYTVPPFPVNALTPVARPQPLKVRMLIELLREAQAGQEAPA
jgi:DNA-binding transcriptional LysR family regulator